MAAVACPHRGSCLKMELSHAKPLQHSASFRLPEKTPPNHRWSRADMVEARRPKTQASSPNRRRVASKSRTSRILQARASSAPPPQDRQQPDLSSISSPLEADYPFVSKEVQLRRNSPPDARDAKDPWADVHPALRPNRPDIDTSDLPIQPPPTSHASSTGDDGYMNIPIWEYPRRAPPIPRSKTPQPQRGSSIMQVSPMLKSKSSKGHVKIDPTALEPRTKSKDERRDSKEKRSSAESTHPLVERPGAKRYTLASAETLDQQGLMDWLAEEKQYENARFNKRRFQEAKNEIAELRDLVQRCKRRISAMIESLSSQEPQALACVDLDARFQLSSRILTAWQINVLKENQAMERGALLRTAGSNRTQGEHILDEVNIIRKAGLLDQETPLTDAQKKAISTIAHLTEQVRALQRVLAEGSKKLTEREAMSRSNSAAAIELSTEIMQARAACNDVITSSANGLRNRSLSSSNSVIEQAIHELLTPSTSNNWDDETMTYYNLPEHFGGLNISKGNTVKGKKGLRHSAGSGSESGYGTASSLAGSDAEEIWPKTFLLPPSPVIDAQPDVPILERNFSIKTSTTTPTTVSSNPKRHSQGPLSRYQMAFDHDDSGISSGGEDSIFDRHADRYSANASPATSYAGSPVMRSPMMAKSKTLQMHRPLPTSSPRDAALVSADHRPSKHIDRDQPKSRKSSVASAAKDQLMSSRKASASSSSSKRSAKVGKSTAKVTRAALKAENRPIRANEPPSVIVGLAGYMPASKKRRSIVSTSLSLHSSRLPASPALPAGSFMEDTGRHRHFPHHLPHSHNNSSQSNASLSLTPQTSHSSLNSLASGRVEHSPMRHFKPTSLRSKDSMALLQTAPTPSPSMRKVQSDGMGTPSKRSSRVLSHMMTKMKSGTSGLTRTH